MSLRPGLPVPGPEALYRRRNGPGPVDEVTRFGGPWDPFGILFSCLDWSPSGIWGATAVPDWKRLTNVTERFLHQLDQLESTKILENGIF